MNALTKAKENSKKDIVKKKLGLLHLNKPHGLWNDTVGLCTTNWVETVIGYIARIRLKSLKKINKTLSD